MPYRPNDAYCRRAGLPSPAPEHLWHPREFTFDAISKIISSYCKAGYIFASFSRFAAAAGTPDITSRLTSYATVAVPVCFSPSNALAIAETIEKLDAEVTPRQNVRGTFFFELGSPSYNLKDPRTQSAIATLANAGHDIGIMLGIDDATTSEALKDQAMAAVRAIADITRKPVYAATFRTVGVAKERVQALVQETQPFLNKLGIFTTHDDFASQSHVSIATTSNGIYRNGHPFDIANLDRPFAMLNLIECWFSREPKWALDRLGSLPEVDANAAAVRREYLDHVKLPILGDKGTTEVVPEAAQHRGMRGYRDAARLQASG